jgi:hypothetical protein
LAATPQYGTAEQVICAVRAVITYQLIDIHTRRSEMVRAKDNLSAHSGA